MRQIIGIVLACFLLNSCTNIAPTSTPLSQSRETRQAMLSRLHEWRFTGKMGIQTTQDSGSATLDWHQELSRFHIALYGPFGANGLTLNGQLGGRVILTMSDGQRAEAASPEALIQKALGWRLPVSYLHYWVRGIPVPGIDTTIQYDVYHRLMKLTQQQWRVEYLSYTQVNRYELPSRLIITGPGLRAKLVVYHWQM